MDSSEIISNKNKFHLWDEFNKKKYFDNISNENFNNVQQLFEKSIDEIYQLEKQNVITNIDVINDKIDSNFKLKLDQFHNQNSLNSNNNVNELEALMKTQEDEMNVILNPTKPPEIDFQNKSSDEPFQENVEDIINKTIEDREKELTNIIQSLPPPKVDETIKQENENTELLKEIIKSQIKMIELLSTMRSEQENMKMMIQNNDNKNELLSISNQHETVNQKLETIMNGINNMKNKKLRKSKEDKI